MFISILGRQPGISLAELEVLFGAENVKKLSDEAASVDSPAPDINRLGGAIKIVDDVQRIDGTSWDKITVAVTQYVKKHVRDHNEGKITLGLSVYGCPSATTKKLKIFMIETKKNLRKQGYSIRVVPNKKVILNSAQVLHNKLTNERNAEIILIKAKSNFWIGRTSGVQDIEALARRDQGRPKRDARVGMLPPKLALTMINLTGLQQQPGAPKTVLDPFCGTGVVLQEALISGHHAYGSDLEDRMIDFTRENLEWIKTELGLINTVRVEQGDAQYHKWTKPFDTVVCETYLGPPLATSPAPDRLAMVRSEVNSLLKTFLANLHKQLDYGAQICIAVPAWRVGGRILHLNLLDDLEKLGYTRRVLKHATHKDLIYYRPDQTVAREILILQKN